MTESDRGGLAAWLNELDRDAWDRQMQTDFSPGGRGMALVEKVFSELSEATDVSSSKNCGPDPQIILDALELHTQGASIFLGSLWTALGQMRNRQKAPCLFSAQSPDRA